MFLRKPEINPTAVKNEEQKILVNSDNKTTPSVALDDATKLLVKAIQENDYKAAFQAIKNNADVNVNALFSKKMDVCTPLQMAVYRLDYKLVKLLLENGANPNILNAKNQSTLELLMMAIRMYVINEGLGEEEQYVPKIFALLSIQKEFSRPIKLDQSKLTTAKQILDLLLCYGLNPNSKWTQKYIDDHNEMAIAASYIKLRNERELVEEFYTSQLGLLMKAAAWGVKKYYFPGEKIDKNSDEHLYDYVLTSQNVKPQALIAAKEIQTEYYRALYPKIDAGVERQLADVLINLILQYLIATSDFSYPLDFSKQIAEKREIQKKAVSFWQHEEDSEEDRETLQQRAVYKNELHKFFTPFFANSGKEMDYKSVKLISEYAVIPKKR